MILTQSEVEHIARLARLRLSTEEMNRFREQLSDILDYAARLQELDTSNISPTSSVLSGQNVLRTDVPHTGLERNVLMQNTMDTEQAQFRVPPILD